MKRPLFLCAVFFLIGIFFSQSDNFVLSMSITFLALFFIFFNYRIKTMLFFFVIFICGLERAKFSCLTLPEDIISKNATLTGVVQNITAVKNYHRAKVKVIHTENNSGFASNIKFNMQVYLSDDKEQIANAGEKIILTGKLILPQQKRNPGGYDEINYFRSHALSYKIFPSKIKSCGFENYLLFYLEQFKNNLAGVYEIVFQPKEASILKSMITGDKSELDDYTSQLYKSAGIYHILAISGLHISIIALLINFLLKFVFNYQTSAFISLLLLYLYCIMTGASISTVRAVIMASVIIVGNLIYREHDLITSLSFAGLLLMIFNPFCIFDIGFEYSFGAIFGIATCTHAIERGISLASLKFSVFKVLSDNYIIKKYFAASVAASLITYVVTAYYFFYFTPYSIFANLFVLPNIVFVVILGFIIGIAGLVSLDIASFMSAPVFLLLKFYEKVCEIFVSLPFSKILVGHVSVFFVVLYCMWIFLLIYMLSAFKEKFVTAKKYFFKFSIIFFFFIVIAVFIPESPEIIMLDVGQGDCFVINCGRIFVVDGGGKRTQAIGNNTGKNVLVPFLDYKAKNYIDAVFVSHSDADHIIGIIELLSNKCVGKIFLSEKINNDELSQKLFSEAEKFCVPIEYLKAGDVLPNKNFSLDCLYPFENTYAENNNDTSLVLKLNLSGTKILFTGDIEKNAEQEILSSGENISADILKLAHHGSKTSSALNFLEQVNPNLAIVSTGKNNSYSHPSKEITQRLKDLNIPLVNTAESGAVTIKILNGSIKIIREVS